MNRKIFGTILIINLAVLTGHAQPDTSTNVRQRLDHDKSRFEHILNKETNNSRVSDDELHKYYLIADELPDWFYHPAQYASSEKFMIGISDPGMDTLRGLQMAVSRGKALLALSQETNMEHISDHFEVTVEQPENMEQNSQYLDFSRMKTSKKLNPENFTVNETYFTKYNEMLVLLSYTESEEVATDTLFVEGELMQLAREDEILLESTVFCKLNIYYTGKSEEDHPGQLSYTFKSRENKFDVVSVYGQDTLLFPLHPYRYIPSSEDLDTTRTEQGFSTGSGLWNAYINLLFSRLNLYNRYLQSNVKSTYDHYSLKNQGLVRTVSRNKISFKLEKIAIKEHKLDIQLHFLNSE